jgi:nucleoside-diphosphate-sugar epimerase
MIALLGATGYIGGSLARVLSGRSAPLHLFCRDPAKLASQSWPSFVRVRPLAEFDAAPFGLVINAIGAGDPARVASLGADILGLTETWDSCILSSMAPETCYVFLSSGAIYGELGQAAAEDSELKLPINRLEVVTPYLLAKLIAELRHRQMPVRRILDLRVFGYADIGISRTSRFFLAELARSVVDRSPFVTSADDMVRDYAGVDELVALIDCWHMAGAPNCVLDLYSRAPLAKSELLEVVRERYGLAIVTSASPQPYSASTRRTYASEYRAAAKLGYAPRRTSIEIVVSVLDALRATTRKPMAPSSARSGS